MEAFVDGWRGRGVDRCLRSTNLGIDERALEIGRRRFLVIGGRCRRDFVGRRERTLSRRRDVDRDTGDDGG